MIWDKLNSTGMCSYKVSAWAARQWRNVKRWWKTTTTVQIAMCYDNESVIEMIMEKYKARLLFPSSKVSSRPCGIVNKTCGGRLLP